MKILVTGGNGFIAQHYIRDIQSTGFDTKTFDLPNNNICCYEDLCREGQDCEMVIHFAAMADINECQKNIVKNHETNIDGTFQVAKYCMSNNKKLIFISTCCVYGNSLDSVETEWSTAPMAEEPYACSKVAGEYIVRGMPNLNYCILRIGTVYGVGMREALFTYITLDSIKTNKIINIDGDGSQTRQLIHIDDLVSGICEATHRFYDGDFKNEIYNLCGKDKISAMQTMRISEEIVGKSALYKYREQRYGQTYDENISILRAKNMLDWEPKIDFYDGMKRTYEEDERFK